jgi:hypothetical protein
MTHSEQLIENIARAIYEGRNGYGARPWGKIGKAHREPYLLDAKAALQEVGKTLPTDSVSGYHGGPTGPEGMEGPYKSTTPYPNAAPKPLGEVFSGKPAPTAFILSETGFQILSEEDQAKLERALNRMAEIYVRNAAITADIKGNLATALKVALEEGLLPGFDTVSRARVREALRSAYTAGHTYMPEISGRPLNQARTDAVEAIMGALSDD